VVKRTLVPAGLSTWMVGIKYPMAGVEGGHDGAPNHLTVRFDTDPAEVSNIANAVPHAAGEAFEYLYGGGAGYGDPFERDPQAVLDDVLDELVSLAAAKRDYGVAFRGSLEAGDLAVDEAATRALRSARAAGSGA
jgi:N-methylhydantoinase B